MNGKTPAISTSKEKNLTAEDLYSELIIMREQINKLIDKVLAVLPPKYGSDAWWEKSDREAVKQLKAGKGTTIHNKNELDAFFRKLGA